MAKSSPLAFLVMALFIGVNSIRIKFYANYNQQVPVHESNSTLPCNNLTLKDWTVRTDTCVIAYMDPNCKSLWSKKISPGEQAQTYVDLGSFHICNEEEGGPQLNLDLTTYYSNSLIKPTVLQSYKNLCSCVNVPEHILNTNTWSIDSHNNDLFAYFEPNCSKQRVPPLFIQTGMASTLIRPYEKQRIDLSSRTQHIIESLGPDPNSTYYNISCSSVRTEDHGNYDEYIDPSMDPPLSAAAPTHFICFIGFTSATFVLLSPFMY